MRKAIAIYCASEEVMALIPILESNPEIEIAGIFDDDPVAALERARSLGIQTRIDADASRFGEPLHAVIDASDAVPFSVRFPEWAGRGLQQLRAGRGLPEPDRGASALRLVGACDLLRR